MKFPGKKASSQGILPDKDNIEVIKYALLPSNISESRSFIWLYPYLSRFIENYSEKVAILLELL